MKVLMKRIDKLEKVSHLTEVVVVVCEDGETRNDAKVRWAREHPDRDPDQADFLIVVELVEPP